MHCTHLWQSLLSFQDDGQPLSRFLLCDRPQPVRDGVAEDHCMRPSLGKGNRMRRRCVASALLLVALSAAALASDRPPAVRWDFGSEESTPLRPDGGVHRDVPGPRPPEYPDFEPGNTAVRLDGRGAHLAFDDPGPASPFDFSNGDAITVEAWVQLDDLRPGENLYVVAKGRTGNPVFAADNQNWALRVREHAGKACVSFLFATPPAKDAVAGQQWHRWTTGEGFAPGRAWHHIAAAYRFGDPSSVRAWIDGKLRTGAWDMGGASNQAPVVDDDAIWIGSALGGHASNSFRGCLDSVAIHRQALDDAVMKTRFRRTGPELADKPAPEVMPDLGTLPSGQVLVTFHEGMPAQDRWLFIGESLPKETARWNTEAFLLPRLPLRYDAWGIRDAWQAPVLTRLAADLTLAPGKHRFLLRVRGLSRLWINGTVVARSKPHGGSPSGEEPITPVAVPPRPGLRAAEHRQQEVVAEAVVGADRACRVVLETLVGGKALRPEPGELCVALETADGRSFTLLAAEHSGATPMPLTESGIESALARQEAALHAFDDRVRRSASASQDDFWKKRHDAARAWASAHAAPTVPAVSDHPVDAFLGAKIERARQESAQTPAGVAEQFHTKVLQILRENCFRCHGEKEKGELRLNSRQFVLKGGASGEPAVVPGAPEESELLQRVRAEDSDERMPPGGKALTAEQCATLETWIKGGALWPAPPLAPEEVRTSPIVGDTAFLRRVYLDTVGLPPSEEDVRAFLADPAPDKRGRVVDRLLADEGWADHWMSYWQDVLAENPTLLNPSLNTTGPFRWFLYDALRDGKALDRLVSELILLRGGPHDGGSAGFGIAADNDAPFAAKGQIVASAFLGIELQCARCHDSPYHSTKQRDLYSLAALFERKPVTVPKSSRVPDAFFAKKARESLIKVTLKPGEPIPPEWPFGAVTGSADDPALDPLIHNPRDPRERLAALVTAPSNTRFAQVVVNRVWKRLMGAGFVEPANDWEGHAPSHPELLDWLAHEFVVHDYDLKHVARVILTSNAYQREAVGQNLSATPERRFFNAPERRRLTAEQVVDSLFAAAGQRMDVEEFTFDPDGRRPASNRISLGTPRRAWMFASLANERDRPSLSLPRARAVADILTAFGWTGSRQNPRTDRETAPNALQPGALANSVASAWLTRAAVGSALAEIAVDARSPESLVDRLFLRYLGRQPTVAERAPLVEALSAGFAHRVVPVAEVKWPLPPERLPRVTWSNHLREEATTIALELERRARIGPPADPRLRPEWREGFEDVVWGITNLREFVWVP